MRRALWRPEAYTGAGTNSPVATVDYWRQDLDHLEPLLQMAYVDARLSLSDHLLLYGDKMSMATSVEARVPFLDLDYMAVAEALPASLRIRGTTRKFIHKKAIAAWVGKDIIARPKRGFETPMDGWFRAELSTYVRDALLGAGSACRLYFDDRALASLLDDHVRGRHNNHRLLFSLLMFELWHSRFIAAGPLPAPGGH
jgi:asparagine synthase (glutamine-hydrolysing)